MFNSDLKASRAAIDVVTIEGCVLTVSFNSSSGPSKQIVEILFPNVLSAISKTFFAASKLSYKSFPIPTDCEPCPGNKNATFFIFFYTPIY